MHYKLNPLSLLYLCLPVSFCACMLQPHSSPHILPALFTLSYKEPVFLMITPCTICLNVMPLTVVCIRLCSVTGIRTALGLSRCRKLWLPSRGHSDKLGDRDTAGSITPYRDRWITKDSLSCLGLHRYSGQSYILTMASGSHWAGKCTAVWNCSLWILV